MNVWVQVCPRAWVKARVDSGCDLLLSALVFEARSSDESGAHCLARMAASESLGCPSDPSVFASQNGND